MKKDAWDTEVPQGKPNKGPAGSTSQGEPAWKGDNNGDQFVEGKVIVRRDSDIVNLAGFEDAMEVPDKYVPEGFKTKDDYLKSVRKNYDLDLMADDENRMQALEDKKFAAGEQWDPVVLQHRQGLPCLVLNTVPQFTAQLVGDWRTNRNGVKVVPQDNGDVDTADIRSDLIRAIELDSRATRVYDSAFESTVQCGEGAYQIAVEYAADDVFDQVIRIKPIDDNLAVVWDRTSIDPTGRDATHCFVDEPMTRQDFEEVWPDHDPSDLPKTYYNDLRASGWCDDDTVRVTAHWRMIERNRFLVMFKDGFVTIIEKDSNDLERLQELHGPVTKSRIAPVRYAQMHIVTGFDILAGPFEYKLSRLPIIRMTGRVVNINGRRIRFGLVRFMKDPVRLRNFWRSVAAEQLGYAPKAQWLAPESAVEGREESFRTAHLKRDPLLVYNDDATAPPQRIEPPAIQQALLNESAVNTQDIKDVTGIQDASLGIKSNETSGKAIMARQREGDVASLTYYDNGNAAVLEGGDVINQLISQIYDSTRVIRVIGQDEAVKLQSINDPYDPKSIDLSTGKYDVAMTTGPSYTTRRVEAADAMMQAVQVWPQLISVAGDLIAKAQDWPGAEELSKRLQKTIPPQYLEGEVDEHGQPLAPPGPSPEQVQQLQQGAMQLHGQNQQLQTENAQLKQKADLDFQKNQIDMFDSYTKRLEVLGKISERDSQGRMAAIPAAQSLNPGGANSSGGGTA